MAQSLLKTEDVAERISASEVTVRRMVKRGELPVVRLGTAVRFRPQDVDALIQSRLEGAPPQAAA